MKSPMLTGSKIEVKQAITYSEKAQVQPAQSTTIQAFFRCAIASLLVTNFVACAPRSGEGTKGTPPVQPTVTSEGPGGTGGGDVLLQASTLAEVEATVDREYANLTLSFTGPAAALRPFVRFDNDAASPTDFARLMATSGSLQRIVEIASELSVGAVLSKTAELTTFPRVVAVRPLLTLDKRREKPCHDTDKTHHDGSAHGTAICISLSRLTRIPNSALKSEIRALLAHEFMHVLGYDENDAQLMQRYFINEAVTGNIQKVAEVVNQFGYEISYAKIVAERPEVADPKAVPAFFAWTRDAHLNFYTPIMTLVGDDANPALKSRIEAKRDHMQRLAAELVALAPAGADPENKKLAAFKALESEWLEAQKMALEIVPINLDRKPQLGDK